METLLTIWAFFQVNILTRPAFFIGFLVLIGYLLLRRTWYESLAGTIKAVVGVLLLGVGAGGLVNNFRPILAALKDRFGLEAAVIDPYFGLQAAQAAISGVGRSFTLMMQVLLVAFLINAVLVAFRKVTKIRTLFITGHIMVLQSSAALWIILLMFPQLQDTNIVFFLGGLLGVYWSVFSNLTVEATQNVTEGGNFAIGHSNMFAVWLANKVAHKFGKNSKKIEDFRLPGAFGIFSENIVSTSLLMFLFFGAIMTIIGPEQMRLIDPSFSTQSFLFYVIEKCLNFAVFLSVLLSGVSLFVNELSVSFEGISSTFLKGAMPAIDCAAIFGFAHGNVVTLGFLFGALGQFLAIAALVIFGSPILIITGFVPVFFDNGTIAVVANKRGGIKAVMVLTFVSGIIQVLGGALAVGLFQMGAYGGYIGNFDWGTVWVGIGFLLNNLGYIGYGLAIVAMLIIPQIQYARNRKSYFQVVEDYPAYLASQEQQ
jgi:ascorbate PTS system EIIC component